MYTKSNQPFKWAMFALIAVSLLLVSGLASAASSVESADGLSVLLSTVIAKFESGQGKILGYAQGVFWTLAGLSFFWNGVQWLFAETGFEQIFAEIVKKVLYLSIFAAVLGVPGTGDSLAVAALGKVKESAVQLAQPFESAGNSISAENLKAASLLKAGAGLSYSIGLSGAQVFLSPAQAPVAESAAPSSNSWISATLTSLTGDIWGTMVRFAFSLSILVIAWVVAVYVFYAYVHIAIQVAILGIEFALVGSMGLFYLAGAGSEWTTEYRNRFLGFVINYMMKFALTMAVVTVMGGVIHDFAWKVLADILNPAVPGPGFNPNEHLANLFMNYLFLGVFAYVFKLCVEQIPATFSALMSASPSSAASSIAGQSVQTGQAALNQGAKAAGAAGQGAAGGSPTKGVASTAASTATGGATKAAGAVVAPLKYGA